MSARFIIEIEPDGEGFMRATIIRHRDDGTEHRAELFGVEAQELHARLCKIMSRKEAR